MTRRENLEIVLARYLKDHIVFGWSNGKDFTVFAISSLQDGDQRYIHILTSKWNKEDGGLGFNMYARFYIDNQLLQAQGSGRIFRWAEEDLVLRTVLKIKTFIEKVAPDWIVN